MLLTYVIANEIRQNDCYSLIANYFHIFIKSVSFKHYLSQNERSVFKQLKIDFVTSHFVYLVQSIEGDEVALVVNV